MQGNDAVMMRSTSAKLLNSELTSTLKSLNKQHANRRANVCAWSSATPAMNACFPAPPMWHHYFLLLCLCDHAVSHWCPLHTRSASAHRAGRSAGQARLARSRCLMPPARTACSAAPLAGTLFRQARSPWLRLGRCAGVLPMQALPASVARRAPRQARSLRTMQPPSLDRAVTGSPLPS